MFTELLPLESNVFRKTENTVATCVMAGHVHQSHLSGCLLVNLFSINQVYRVSDMELVRVLPSAEDEVNVACFHPSVGGGLVYGTKVNHILYLHL